MIIGSIPERLRLIDRIAKRLPQEVPAAIPLDITNEGGSGGAGQADPELAPGCRRRGPFHRVRTQTLMGPDAVPFLEGPGPSDVAKSFEISAWSYAALARAVLPVMNEGGSIVGMDFDPRTAMPDYNWMGVSKAALGSGEPLCGARGGQRQADRSNLVAAGPIKTLAAKAISGTATDDARKLTMLNEYWDSASPIGWNVDDPTVVGKSVVALLSDWLPGTTGSIVYVDGGASTTPGSP